MVDGDFGPSVGRRKTLDTGNSKELEDGAMNVVGSGEQVLEIIFRAELIL